MRARVRVANFQNRKFWYALSLFLLVIGVVLVVMLQAIWARSGAALSAAKMQADSTLHLAFQFDREFLRFRHQVELLLAGQSNLGVLGTRYEIWLSRVHLLENNPTTYVLQQEDEYQQLMPALKLLAIKVEPLMASELSDPVQWREVLADMDSMGPLVQAFIQAANRSVVRRIERQELDAKDQDRLITWLTGGLLFFLLMGFFSLILAQRKAQIERVALEQLNCELDEARLRAEAASISKSRFLANMSHELRTPFNGLLGMLQILEQSVLSDEQRHSLNAAQRAASNYLSLISDILDLSALDAEQLKLHLQPMVVVQAVHEVFDWLAPTALEKNLPLVLNVSVPDELTTRCVLGDATRIRQVLLNLLKNAIKFTVHGQVSLTLSAVEIDGQRVHWSVVIKDTGAGMSQEVLKRLFQRFQPGDDSLNRQHGGAGVGLEISRALARCMGGDVRAESIQGQGSTFFFDWVTEFCHSTVPLSDFPLHVDLQHLADELPDLSKPKRFLRVLVVDDHSLNRAVLGALAKGLDCQVNFAEDGGQGLQMIAAHDFDVVLMDLHMPYKDGFACVSEVRSLEDATKAQVPIIAVTADTLPETKRRVMASGFSGFIEKPVVLAELKKMLKSLNLSWRSDPSGTSL